MEPKNAICHGKLSGATEKLAPVTLSNIIESHLQQGHTQRKQSDICFSIHSRSSGVSFSFFRPQNCKRMFLRIYGQSVQPATLGLQGEKDFLS